MRENYDVIVVGAGPAGIMASYEFVLKNPNLSVLLIDKGRAVTARHCPIKDKKIKQCPVIKDNEPGCLPAFLCGSSCWFSFAVYQLCISCWYCNQPGFLRTCL